VRTHEEDFEDDFEWQAQFAGHFSEIALQAMRVNVAPAEEDWKRNTDFVLQAVVPTPSREIRISARVRRYKYASRYPDEFTVRLDRPSGAPAEMPKIRQGWGDFTIYGFESEPGSNRLGPWFLGNVEMLRDYLRRGGYYKVKENRDRSSRFAAFNHGDMPLGFIKASGGMRVLDDKRIWERCRSCWWWRQSGGVVMPLDEDGQPGTGYGRKCIACGFRWQSGWVMSLTPQG
jgi:hypothetical protein